MDQGYVYKITSPSGRIYIGQTKYVRKRINNYKSGKAKGQTKLYNSIQKYGWEQHSFEIIDQCNIFCKRLLDMLEIYWIKEYDSHHHGLNCNDGGNTPEGRIVSEATKQKLRMAGLGHKVSDVTKDKLRLAASGNTFAKGKTGYKHTPEAILKIAAASRKRFSKLSC